MVFFLCENVEIKDVFVQEGFDCLTCIVVGDMDIILPEIRVRLVLKTSDAHRQGVIIENFSQVLQEDDISLLKETALCF